ncbi:hypothetical protein BDU57DRAFT_454273 [Ampelomyces quisqualis]|uniref:Uncharacterized protein n=1 Tax=Ampelomyces quisqualis TaxID=50730 RepID=A0A6A5QI73_AMPQU|nr:hypothetical protein BDU57DRAFT_454273 [Ampelomyces quisqualis]
MALGAYFDPVGETEPDNTIYTLTVRCPPRPPPKWLPNILTRTPVTHPNSGSAYTIKPDETNAKLDCFEEKHLTDLPTKVVKIGTTSFPLEMRCGHLRHSTTCTQGCYVLEKGGSISRKKCTRTDCDGHVYCGRVKEDEGGKSCFGKKGERLVCKNAPTAAPRPAKAGTMVLNGAAAAVDCSAGPDPPEPGCEAAAPSVDADPAAAPVADALPVLGAAAADAPNFSVPAVMTRG